MIRMQIFLDPPPPHTFRKSKGVIARTDLELGSNSLKLQGPTGLYTPKLQGFTAWSAGVQRMRQPGSNLQHDFSGHLVAWRAWSKYL
jgi:hypothetical protein